MKLIIKQYLSALRERDELDVVLPDLLSQMGLNVFSRPGRGTRQSGVDVGAVGSLNGESEKVYLLTIKPGDVTRKSWSNDTPQAVRSSLDEIQDAYILNRMPTEHRDKDIVICLCCGGEVQEQVREQWEGYIKQRTTAKLGFQEWNGDKLADLIQSNFLREDLLPEHARSNLRKAVALVDEPEVSYRHFAVLITSLSAVAALDDKLRVMAIRQMSICLWILLTWAREAKNVESAYLAGEFTMLQAWAIARDYLSGNTKVASDVEAAFLSVHSAYLQTSSEFLRTNVMPYVDKVHAVSTAARGSSSLDVNLKLFDLLGRLATNGLWMYWEASCCSEEDEEIKAAALEAARACAGALRSLISNNPALLLPAKDDQAIDIFIALWLLALDLGNRKFIVSWLAEIMDRARFSYDVNLKYPSALTSYAELLEHPKSRDSEYRERTTQASILYPVIAFWAALLDDETTYESVVLIQKECLSHCTFQLWYPDDASEAQFYTNEEPHGATLLGIALKEDKESFLDDVLGECDESPKFGELSAVKFGWWPLIVVACRHYRVPIPLHFVRGLREPKAGDVEGPGKGG